MVGQGLSLLSQVTNSVRMPWTNAHCCRPGPYFVGAISPAQFIKRDASVSILFSEAGTEETAASVVMLFVRIAKRMPSVKIDFFLASIPSCSCGTTQKRIVECRTDLYKGRCHPRLSRSLTRRIKRDIPCRAPARCAEIRRRII